MARRIKRKREEKGEKDSKPINLDVNCKKMSYTLRLSVEDLTQKRYHQQIRRTPRTESRIKDPLTTLKSNEKGVGGRTHCPPTSLKRVFQRGPKK